MTRLHTVLLITIMALLLVIATVLIVNAAPESRSGSATIERDNAAAAGPADNQTVVRLYFQHIVKNQLDEADTLRCANPTGPTTREISTMIKDDETYPRADIAIDIAEGADAAAFEVEIRTMRSDNTARLTVEVANSESEPAVCDIREI